MTAQELIRDISTRFVDRLDKEVLVDGKAIGLIEYLEDDNTIRIYSADVEDDTPESYMEAEGPEEAEPEEIAPQYEELSDDEKQDIAEALHDNEPDNGGTGQGTT